MKTVILAGGYGTRLSEETETIPKPLVPIGGRPILWHILKHYGHFGFNEFVIALGYKGELIKRYFLDYSIVNRDFSISLDDGSVSVQDQRVEPWRIQLVDTGLDTVTGGRIKRLSSILNRDTFMLTYGDGVSDVNVKNLLKFHKEHGKLATVLAVRPPARFGGISLDSSKVVGFAEKNQTDAGWINGGYFVLEPEVLNLISEDSTHWEREPMESLASEGQLMAYQHESFWHCMDTLRDKRALEGLWASGQPPWRVWT